MLTKEEALLLLQKHDQIHVLKYYDELSEEEQKKLLAQVADLDWDLLSAIEKTNEEEKGEITPLGAVEIKEIEERKEEFVEEGLKAMRDGKVGCILLAGGIGSRR